MVARLRLKLSMRQQMSIGMRHITVWRSQHCHRLNINSSIAWLEHRTNEGGRDTDTRIGIDFYDRTLAITAKCIVSCTYHRSTAGSNTKNGIRPAVTANHIRRRNRTVLFVHLNRLNCVIAAFCSSLSVADAEASCSLMLMMAHNVTTMATTYFVLAYCSVSAEYIN